MLVLPMHITIIACGVLSPNFDGGLRLYSALALIIFLSLKTLVDLFMHAVEHYATGGERTPGPPRQNV